MRPIKGYEFRSAVESAVKKFGKSILNNDNVNVYWTDRNNNQATVRSDFGVVTLPNIADDAVISHQYLDNYIGWLFHETLHVAYSKQTKADPSGIYVNSLFQAIEDAYVERKAIDKKVVGNVEGFLTDQANGMVDESLSAVQDWTDPANYPFALAMYARGFSKVPPLAGGLEPIFEEATERLKKSRGSDDNLAIAEWVFKQLKLPPESNPPPQGKGKEEGDGEGEGEGGGNGEGEGEPKSSQRKIQTIGKRKVPGQNQKTEAPSLQPKKMHKSSLGSGTYSKDADLCNKERHMCSGSRYTIKTVGSAKLRYEVRKLFEMSGLDEWQMNRKNGALNPNALHKVSTGSTKVFKRHLEEEGIDSAVVVVLDVSGSMSGDSLMEDAVMTCATLLDTLSKAGVATAMVTFGGESALFKPFNMPLLKLMPDLARIGDGGGTNDYFAVRYSHELLLNRRERRKIAFVITDGQGDVDETRRQVASGERLGITTIGIGIGCNVSETYEKSVLVKSIKHLANTTFNHIKLAA